MELRDELYRRYGSGAVGLARRWRFWRKKYAWALVVGGARVLKRLIDILVSLSMLLVLSPLFLIIALMIKLTDGGPVLNWQTRVGRWGREFPFPKFHSSVARPAMPRQDLTEENDHSLSDGLEVKQKPVTWTDRVIRKLGMDELPQLVCVLKGDMSLVGPRPPLPCEVALYKLADRRRLDVTPGLICHRQVSGHGDIPFDQQIELDVQYIESKSLWFDIKLLLRIVKAVLLGRKDY